VRVKKICSAAAGKKSRIGRKPMKLWPAFARSERSPLFGKRTVRMSTTVSEETAETLRKLAREASMSDGEFIADLLAIRAHGRGQVEKIIKSRLDVVSGIAQESRNNSDRESA